MFIVAVTFSNRIFLCIFRNVKFVSFFVNYTIFFRTKFKFFGLFKLHWTALKSPVLNNFWCFKWLMENYSIYFKILHTIFCCILMLFSLQTTPLQSLKLLYFCICTSWRYWDDKWYKHTLFSVNHQSYTSCSYQPISHFLHMLRHYL